MKLYNVIRATSEGVPYGTTYSERWGTDIWEARALISELSTGIGNYVVISMEVQVES